MGKEATQFKEGNKGKPKGATNKATRMVKEVFAEVFNELQEDPEASLGEWAKKNTTEFYKLASKLLPIQVTGEGGGPIETSNLDNLSFEQLMQYKYGKDYDKK